MKRSLLLLLFSLLFLGGCYYTKLEVYDVSLGKVSLVSTSKATVGLNVQMSNNAKTSVSVEGIDGVIYKEGMPFADVVLLEAASIEALSKESLGLKLGVDITNPLLLLSTGLNIRNWNIDDFTISGKITIRSGRGGKKVFNVKSMPIKELANYIS